MMWMDCIHSDSIMGTSNFIGGKSGLQTVAKVGVGRGVGSIRECNSSKTIVCCSDRCASPELPISRKNFIYAGESDQCVRIL